MKKIASFAVFVVTQCAVMFAPETATAANAITEQQTRTEHMRACLTNGGQKDVCTCSYDEVTKVISVESLMDVNRALTNKIPADKSDLKALSKATRDCAKAIKNGTYTPASSAYPTALPTAPAPTTSTTLPPLPAPPGITPTTTPASTGSVNIPTPPSFKDLDNLTIPAPPTLQASAPNFDKEAAKEGTESYFTDTEIDAGEDAGKVAKQSATAALPRGNADAPLDVEVQDLRDKYQGQHDQAFFEAAAQGNIRALTAINQYLKSPDIIDRVGNTPLIIAVEHGQANAASYLIQNGANVNYQNKNGQSPLHIAVYKNRQDIVQLLLRSKANVNASYGNGFSPLILALMSRNEMMVQTLIIAGANIKAPMADGNFPIHIATSMDDAKDIQVLKNYGADLNVENAQGYTPLMVAASQNRVFAASALLGLGADFNRTDIYGRTPAQIAYSLGNQQVVNLILTMQEKTAVRY